MSGLSHNIFGELTVEAFLKDYWQKKPLLVRGAVDPLKIPVDGSQLADLSFNEDVESRIVIGPQEAENWQVSFGPFNQKQFSRLPKSHWTLLVQAVERFLPELVEIQDLFSFIPKWRFDDVMVSFASDQGGVGAHLDHYDVFLIQARGNRRWRIEEKQREDDHYLEGIDLRVLAEFNPTQEWLLEPGDMLYLPPEIPHEGVAQGECVTVSVGFRAPSLADLFAARAESIAHQLDDSERFVDPELSPNPFAGEISRESLKQVINMMNGALKSSSQPASWFGRLVTEPTRDSPYVDSCDLKQAAWVRQSPGARIAFFSEKDSLRVFHNGEEDRVPLSLKSFVVALCKSRKISKEDWSVYLKVEGFKELLLSMQQSESVFFKSTD